MIAAATSHSWFQGFVLGWFDLIFLVVLGIGYWRGRKNGMSREFWPVIQWLLIILVGAFTYQLLGNALIRMGAIKMIFGRSVNTDAAAFISAYLLVALIIFIIFSFLKRRYNEKLAGGNTFGSGEYYLGMISGIVRYLCIVIFVLALLNAPIYSAADVQAQKEYNNRWYGGGMAGYSGDFIPSVNEMQDSVFKNSFTGQFIKDDLSLLLIDAGKGVSAKAPVIHIGN